MAMRLYTKKEFEGELGKLGLSKTDYSTDTTYAWRTKDGKHIPVPLLPRGQRYPDYILDKIILMI